MADEEEVQERDYVAEAEEQGWKEDGPLDAQAFVEKGEKIAGILKSKNDRLENRIESLEQSNRQFGEYHKQTLEKQKQKNSERISELEGDLAQAITDSDGSAAVKTQREIDSLREEDVSPPDDAQAWAQLPQD